MQIVYYKDAVGNFGDDLNELMWPRLLPEDVRSAPDTVMVGIGNAVADRIMEAASPGDQHNKADAVTPKPSPKRSRRRRAAPRADAAVEGAPAHASLQ